MTGAEPVPANRFWNSWESDHPAAMRFLPLGLELRPCAYSASQNAFTDFPASAPGLTLGPRAVTADGARLRLAHAGTELDLVYGSPHPRALTGSYRVRAHGEWGLRFWVILVLRLMPPGRRGRLSRWRFDDKRGLALARHGRTHVAVGANRRPLLVTVHRTLDDLRAEMEDKGYWYLDSRGARGAVMALRYNLEEMPALSFAAVADEDRPRAAARIEALLSTPAQSPPTPTGERQCHPTLTRLGPPSSPTSPAPGAGEGLGADPLAAVREVMAWNTVWDPVNRRPYTALSRNWGSRKFGGWGVWLDDLFFHALMASAVDRDLARENLEAALGNATSEGNLACLITGRDAWIDRSQPPIGSLIAWLLHLRLGGMEWLARAWPALSANHRWWLARRDGNGDGLYEYGSSDVGSGLYVGTKLAAKDESFMDNSPVHDEAEFDPSARTLTAADVGLNSMIALDAEMLALIAAKLGKAREARRHGETALQLKARIAERLWDGERGVFANRLWSGRFVRSLAPTSFFPLLAGAASPAQAGAMARLLGDPAKFGGDWLLPSVTRDDPAFGDNVYWRGRIWPPLNFLAWMGLRRAGFAAEASRLAHNGWCLFQRAWANRACPENFNAESGEAFDQPDTDSFYGWGALMPFIALGERIDVSPWEGWSFARGAEGEQAGPVLSPWGVVELRCEKDTMELVLDGRRRLATSLERLTGVSFADGSVRVTLPPGPAGWIAVPEEGEPAARLGEAVLAGRRAGEMVHFTIPRRGAAALLEIQP